MLIDTILLQANAPALDQAIRAAIAPNMLLGVNAASAGVTNGKATPAFSSVMIDDATSAADQNTASTIMTAHDPVFLAVDKPSIKSDNVDAATITISAPKPGAAAVTLRIGGSAMPVTLTNGVGSVQVTSAAPASIAVSVQNPQNRT